MKYKVGIIGFGMAGSTFHAPFVSNVADLELHSIATSNKENLASIQKHYPTAKVVKTAEEIFNDQEIDLVVLAVPNAIHFQLGKSALLHGKHVVIDKPFTTSVQEADELIAIAEDKKLLLSAFQNRRWDSDFLTIQKVLSSQLLGRIVEFEARFERFRNFIKPNTWKEENTAGAGILYDLGAHLIDQALVLFGLPEEITAHLESQRNNSKIHDSFHLRLGYETMTVLLRAGMLMKEPGIKYIIYGDKGSLVKAGVDIQEERLKLGAFPKGDPQWGTEPTTIQCKINTEISGLTVHGSVVSEKGNYTGYYQNVADALGGKHPLAVTALQARSTIRIIELALESNAEKCTVPYSF